jgi:hypothetical protein
MLLTIISVVGVITHLSLVVENDEVESRQFQEWMPIV